MSKGKSGPVPVRGMMLLTVLGVLVFTALGWFAASYYYNQERKVARERLLNTNPWEPVRVERADARNDCDGGRLREESALRQKEVSAFDLSKMLGFSQSASAARARGLQRILKDLGPSNLAFIESYACDKNSVLPRDGREQQLSGVISANAIAVATWLNADRIPDLVKVLWIGRDVQATEGLFAFDEGVQIMEAAYSTLADHLQAGALDVQLNSIAQTVKILIANEESAQLQWQTGANLLLADLYGVEWDQNPPTPMRAKAMVEGVDDLVAGLAEMPDIANQPYPERRKTMEQWNQSHDMTQWDARFSGFGDAGLRIDARSTRTHAQGRALLIGLALRAHKKKTRRCPRALEDLVKGGFLDTLPLDPITNEPFIYDRKACSITSGTIKPGGPVVVKASE